jgi:hypothetical protein
MKICLKCLKEGGWTELFNGSPCPWHGGGDE